LGIRFFNTWDTYGDSARQLNLSSFFGSLFFLQTRFTTVFGSNSPLWSLFNEFWYYVLFPVLICVVLSAKRRSISLLAYAGAAVLTSWILGPALIGFVVWLAGGAIALTPLYFRFGESRRWAANFYTLCAMALAGICLFSARTNQGLLGSDLAVGLSFALLTHGIVQIRATLRPVCLRVARIVAGFSYSLYVLHYPLLLLIRAKLLPTSRWQPNGIHLLWGAGIAIGVVLYAFTIGYITERNTSFVRSLVRRRWELSLCKKVPDIRREFFIP